MLVVNSMIARNLAVAHAGGGIWARGDLTLVNTTVADNYAEGEGGGVLAAGRTTLISSTLTRNIAPIARQRRQRAEASRRSPASSVRRSSKESPVTRSRAVAAAASYEFVSRTATTSTPTTSCVLTAIRRTSGSRDPRLARLEDDLLGFVMVPLAGQPGEGPDPQRIRAVAPCPTPCPPGTCSAPYVDWDFVLDPRRSSTSCVTSGRPATSAPCRPPRQA